MLPQLFGKILNSTFSLFKSKGYFLNPLTLLEESAEGIGATVKYGEGNLANVTFENGMTASYTLQNDGKWELKE
jgi:hypothetical protein